MSKKRRREISEEIEAHLEMATRERVERGELPDQAREAARREFGNVDLVQRNMREVWASTAAEQLWQDARFGARILWHSPGLSAAAVLLVALVVGGNTTIYSIVHNLLTAPAPGVEARNLVSVGMQIPNQFLTEPYTSYPNFEDYAARGRSVQRIAGVSDERFTVVADQGSYAIFGGLVTTAYFETLGVRMSSGRALREEDATLAPDGLTAVISHRFWRERFRADAAIVGRRITINGTTATIVGVAAPRFLGATLTPGEDIWVPITAYYDALGSRAGLLDRARWTVMMIAQLPPGTSLPQARAEFETLGSQLEAAYPVENKSRRPVISSYSATAMLPTAQIFPRFLALFSIITAITLLVVSANVANLMLARAVVRQRETAVRQSLGASRARIVRMLLAEGAAVSIVAWMAAVILAWWTSKAVVRLVEPSRASLLPDFELDWTIAAYAFALTMAATLVFSTAPAVRSWRQQLLPWLKAGEQGASPERSRLSRALVVLQLAFSVVLLTSAGLAHRSVAMLDSDVGFDKEQLVLVTVRARRTGTAVNVARTAAERDASFAALERVRERLGNVPNVTTVSYSRRVPGAYFLATVPALKAGQAEPVQVMLRPVGPDYLQVLTVSPRAGRSITTADRRGGHRVAVINEHLAATLWPGQSALGQTLTVGTNRETVEIVGVSPNVLFDGPVRDARPHYVLVAEQQVSGNTPTDPRFYIRYRGALEGVTPAIAKAIAEVDAEMPIVSIETMNSRLKEVLSLERTVSRMLVAFAVVSLLVAILGQYAMAAFNMQRRTREFGVRLALGASTNQVQRAVIYEALRTTGAGLLLGLMLSLAAGIVGRQVLFGVTPTDPPTYIGVVVVLAVASVIASYLPAWRAGRVNVMQALRQE